jgi:hypothetical protein
LTPLRWCVHTSSHTPFLPLLRISRGENKQSTDFHFFTSHFYTTLSNDGAEAVKSWTAKKNIDIFKKRLIFVPINKDLHWSLCIIVNPGAALLPSNKNKKKEDYPFCCMLFIDSKKMHAPSKVQNNISKWLNSEWQRGGREHERTNPFNTKSLPLFSPKGKFSGNSLFCSLRHRLTMSLFYQFLPRPMTMTVEFSFVAMRMQFFSSVMSVSHMVMPAFVVAQTRVNRCGHSIT